MKDFVFVRRLTPLKVSDAGAVSDAYQPKQKGRLTPKAYPYQPKQKGPLKSSLNPSKQTSHLFTTFIHQFPASAFLRQPPLTDNR